MINKKYNIDREIKKAERGLYFHQNLKGNWLVVIILYIICAIFVLMIKGIFKTNVPFIFLFIETIVILYSSLYCRYIQQPKTYEKMHILKLTVEHITSNIEQIQSEGEEGVSYIGTTANLRLNEMRHSRIKNIIRYIERNL